MAEFDINKVKGNDRFIAGGAVLMLILAFFPWRSASGATVAGIHVGGFHVSMFGNGSYGPPKLALLLALVAGGIVIARLMGALDNVNLPAGVNLITLAACGLAAVILVLQYLLGFKYSAHPGFGYYLGLADIAAMTYFAFLNFQASGEKIPDMPSSGGGATPPPPPPPAAPDAPTS